MEDLHVGGGDRQYFQGACLDHFRHLKAGSKQLAGENLDRDFPLAPFLHEFLEIQGPVMVGAFFRLIMSKLDIPLGRCGSRSGRREGQNDRHQESNAKNSFHTFLLGNYILKRFARIGRS